MKSSKSVYSKGVPSTTRSQGTAQRHHSSISLKEQLSEATLQNSRHLALLSRIDHLASANAESSAALITIKRLIERSGLLDFESNRSSQTSPLKSRALSHHDDTLTPPVTDSETHSDVVTLSDADLTYRSHSVSNHVASTAFQTLPRDANISQNIYQGIENNLDNNKHKHNTTATRTSTSSAIDIEQTDNCLLDILDMASTEVAMKTTAALVDPQAAPTLQTVEAHSGDKDTGVVKEGDEGDEDDFTLEEELEGIADAPVEKRAAMRKALREKQTVMNRQMRESAADKRRIAEKEAYLLRQTLLRDGISISPTQAGSNNGHVGHKKDEATGKNSVVVTYAAPTTSTTTIKTTLESVEDTDTESHRAAAFVPVDDSDDESKIAFRPVNSRRLRPYYASDGSQSSAIINIETETPKNSSRFGITFDPSKLDEATTNRISGIMGNKDSRRSVLVQNIGPETTMHEFLAYIRGGSVLDVKLVADPSDGGNTQNAMVTFKTSKEAHACLELGSSFVSQSGLAHEWRFGLLPTASYPSNDIIPSCSPGYVNMPLAEEPTRCLSVQNFPKNLINELCTELYLNKFQIPNKVHVLEEMWFAKDTLHIHFTSIQEAKKAHGIISLLHYGRYRAGVHYSTDPCAQTEACLSSDGTVKTASDGCQGLKSLLETTGLVSYAKLFVNKMKSSVTASAPRSTPRSVPMSVFSAAPAGAPTYRPEIQPVVQQKPRSAATWSHIHSTASQPQVLKPAMASFSNSTANLLMSIDPGMCGAATQAKVDIQLDMTPSIDVDVKPVPATGSSPWTDTLMSGLDMF